MTSFPCWFLLSGCPQSLKLNMWILSPWGSPPFLSPAMSLLPLLGMLCIVRPCIPAVNVGALQNLPSFLTLHISSTTKCCLSYFPNFSTVYSFLCSLVSLHCHHFSPERWEQHPSSSALALSAAKWPFGYFYLQTWTCHYLLKFFNVCLFPIIVVFKPVFPGHTSLSNAILCTSSTAWSWFNVTFNVWDRNIREQWSQKGSYHHGLLGDLRYLSVSAKQNGSLKITNL